jgi:hypothetical protein
LVFLALSVHAGAARADQLLMVTEYACRSAEEAFILTTHAFDSENGETDSTPGFEKINKFGKVNLSCALGRRKLRASLWMESRPRQGEGAQGLTIVERISLDRRQLFHRGLYLQWDGGGFQEIRVRAVKNGVSLDSCTARSILSGEILLPDSSGRVSLHDFECKSEVLKLR